MFLRVYNKVNKNSFKSKTALRVNPYDCSLPLFVFPRGTPEFLQEALSAPSCSSWQPCSDHTINYYSSCIKYWMEGLVMCAPPIPRCYITICLPRIVSQPFIICRSQSSSRCNDDGVWHICSSSI